MAKKIYTDDEGSLFKIDTVADVDDATIRQVFVLKPDKTTILTWNCVLSGDNNHTIEYTSLPGEFSVSGTYKAQAWIEAPGGKWRGETFSFKVYDRFK